jgi:hypothetical protein
MARSLVWSFGGGTQSVAIAVLIADGRLPVPKRIVMADTGRENPATWAYLEEHVQPLLATVGAEVEIIPAHEEPDLYSPKGVILLPAFTQTGKLQGFCSGWWKRDRIMRWLRAEGYGPKRPVKQWIGISLDEIGRAKEGGAKWCKLHWPLLFDVPMRRPECVKLVTSIGLPTPPKSSCWMCPHMQNEQWVQLKRNHPDHWKKAVEVDTLIRERDERGGLFLHRSLVPLAEADLSLPPEPESSLFGPTADCDSGHCFV